MGVLINPERPGKVREFRDARGFAAAVEAEMECVREDYERLRSIDPTAPVPPPPRIVVMIQVRQSVRAPWTDLVEYWSGRWKSGDGLDIPRPTKRDLIAAARTVGARYVKGVVRVTPEAWSESTVSH